MPENTHTELTCHVYTRNRVWELQEFLRCVSHLNTPAMVPSVVMGQRRSSSAKNNLILQGVRLTDNQQPLHPRSFNACGFNGAS